MPTGTFFRLPEEKRQRLLDAAWNEFTAVSFSESSISRIIQEAGIPRGSFYQYFEDKEDLFIYLMSQFQSYFLELLERTLMENNGDIYAMPLTVFDAIIRENGEIDPMVRRCISIAQLNMGMNLLDAIIMDQPEKVLEVYRRAVDTSQLRMSDQAFTERLCFVLTRLTAFALADILSGHLDRKAARKGLIQDIEIVKYGSIRTEQDAVLTATRRNLE